MSSPDPIEWSIPVAFHFRVKVGGSVISFCEVKGIECSIEIEPVVSGGDNSHCYYVPKSRTFNDLVLKRGVVRNDDSFFKWCKGILASEITQESITPQDVEVTLLGEDGNPILCWLFTSAYPIKWTLGDFVADKSEIALETVTLKYYSFDVVRV